MVVSDAWQFHIEDQLHILATENMNRRTIRLTLMEKNVKSTCTKAGFLTCITFTKIQTISVLNFLLYVHGSSKRIKKDDEFSRWEKENSKSLPLR